MELKRKLGVGPPCHMRIHWGGCPKITRTKAKSLPTANEMRNPSYSTSFMLLGMILLRERGWCHSWKYHCSLPDVSNLVSNALYY